MPSSFGFAAYLTQVVGLNKGIVYKDLREYLLSLGLTHQEIVDAQKSYDADPLHFSDPVPLNPAHCAQRAVQDFPNALENLPAHTNFISTATGISMHGSDHQPSYQNNLLQDVLSDPATESQQDMEYDTTMNYYDSDHVPNIQSDIHRQMLRDPATESQQAMQYDSPMEYYDSDHVLSTQSVVHREVLSDFASEFQQSIQYNPEPEYYSASHNFPYINPNVLDRQVTHRNHLPHINNQGSAYATATSAAAQDSSVPENNPVSGLKPPTRAVVRRAVELRPRAIMKKTGRVVRASTLHFNQLVTDNYLEIDDELHVPLAAIKRADGSLESARDQVAVMIFQGRADGWGLSKWLVHCAAIGGNVWEMVGSGPTDFCEKLSDMGMMGSTGRNWSGKVRVVRNGQDQGTVTEFKSKCFT